MTPQAPARKEPPPEDVRAFAMRPLGGIIPRVTRASFRRRSPAAAQIMLDWMEIMGPVLGPRTVPQKLSAGTLTIGCQGPVAMELQHLSTQLIERLNTHLGASGDRAPIQRLRFVPMPILSTLPKTPRPVALPPPPPLPEIAPGPLHDALARLGQRVAARQKPR
ncbi:DciA family protein [Acidisoma sp. 7E03]